MATEKQIAANRRNAIIDRPRTPRGKAFTRLNGTPPGENPKQVIQILWTGPARQIALKAH